MNDLQYLVTGMIAGALMRQNELDVDVDVPQDSEGNWKPEVNIVGRKTGQKVRIIVEDDNDRERVID